MNLGELRALTAGLPDEYEIVTSPGDATWWETSADSRGVQAPVAGAPGLVILDGGQEITEQYLLPIRLDLDDHADMPGKDVPLDWEVQNVHTGEWAVWETVRPKRIPSCLIVSARPGPAYWAARS